MDFQNLKSTVNSGICDPSHYIYTEVRLNLSRCREVISKKNKDGSLINNLKPINLLQNNYKISMKVLLSCLDTL